MAVNRLRAAVVEHEWTEKLARSNALIAALGHVAARVGSAPDIEGVMQTLGEELRNLDLTCLVALCTPPGSPELAIRYTSLPQRIVRQFERATGYKMGEYRTSTQKLSAHIDLTRNPRPVILTDSAGAAAEILGGFPRSKIIKILQSAGVSGDVQTGHFPLMIDQKAQGILWLWGENLHEEDLPAMSIFANQVAIAIENARLLGEVQRLASIDELTGLYNRRHFLSMAQVEFSRGLRYKRALSAMLLDIDHFKKFNDTYGHALGDRVLEIVAKLCKQSLRNTDILGRYGGEEFVILLPETSLEVAKVVAERLRKSVSGAVIPIEGGALNVTVSIGVAENNCLTPTLETLIARADQAMYIAKYKGRDQVATSI
jgi:diguanylate cyclase (GGDEF)-like protein